MMSGVGEKRGKDGEKRAKLNEGSVYLDERFNGGIVRTKNRAGDYKESFPDHGAFLLVFRHNACSLLVENTP